MRHLKSYFAAIMLASTCTVASSAQEALRSAYFLEGYNYRHELNPAFAPERNYVSFPVLGNLSLGFNSNVGLSTFLYPMNGELATFMHPDVSASEFLGKLRNVNHIQQELDLTILSFGFRGFGGYNTFSLGVRENIGMSLPKDLFTFMKLGQDGTTSHYNFKNIGINANAMAEVAFGHSRQILPQLRVGAKLKFLLGVGDANIRISDMDVTLGDEKWSVRADGEMDICAGDGLKVPTYAESGKHYDNPDDANLIDWDGLDYDKFGLSGFGAAIDLGATYQLHPDLEISASVLDLGFVSWSNAVHAKTGTTTWEFDGFKDVAIDKNSPNYETNKFDQQLENLGNDLEDAVEFHRLSDGGSRTSGIGATITVGAAYTAPFYRGLKGGLLFTQRIDGLHSWTEGRISANLIPVSFFDLSVNYALSTFGSSLGWIINIHPKGFNLFVGSDFTFYKVTPQFVPVNNLNANVQFGINFTFGSKSKKDALKPLLPSW